MSEINIFFSSHFVQKNIFSAILQRRIVNVVYNVAQIHRRFLADRVGLDDDDGAGVTGAGAVV